MELKDKEEHPIRRHLRHSSVQGERLKIEIQDDEKDGTFHQEPSDLVVNSLTPLIGTHLTISGVHKIKHYEHYQSHKEHKVQQIVKEID
jgi:hypothetical protein